MAPCASGCERAPLEGEKGFLSCRDGPTLLLFADSARDGDVELTMKWILARALVGLVVAAAVVYLGDWAVWRVRVALGGGMGTVEVSRFVVASLKGNKEEYYPDGSATVDCSRSLFPQAGSGACWWLERHRVVFER